MKTFLTVLLISIYGLLLSQDNENWNNKFEFPKTIVRNEGQFSSLIKEDVVLFAHPGFSEQVFFCPTKVYINLKKVDPVIESDEEIREKGLRNHENFESEEDWNEFQDKDHKVKYSTDMLVTEWLGTNPNAQIISEGESDFTHGYLIDRKGKGKSVSGVKSYKKIIYKNLYPNIDVEYVMHEVTGFKYSIIIHPGGDITQVKLSYSKPGKLKSNGNIITSTLFGDIIDHAPYTYYVSGKKEISSSYLYNNNTVSFQLGNYDASQTIIVDPWTQLPAFATNWDCVWECETDAAGNAYIIGGADNLQLLKYNPAGTLQWTYNTPYDTSSWLGTMVTDNAGNTFVTQGSVAAMIRVSSAGALAWSVGNISGQLSGEFWNIALNCDQTRLITAGTGGGLPPQPYIYDVNPANGALISSLQVGQSAGLFTIEEVRSICATENEKYYYMTHDTIGYITEVFGVCPNGSIPFKTNHGYNLGYKLENWRYNNCGIEALAYYGGFIYVNRGNQLHKRDFSTGAIITSVTIPGGGYASAQVQNSGIAIDNCGNVFVGSKAQIVKFDANLTQLATYALTAGYNVYDVAIGAGGEVIACGATGTGTTSSRTGFVTSINGGACAPYAMTCCNPNICDPGALCINDAPVTLIPETTGGTWSSTAPGFNTATGTLDPAAAGVGSYTVTYTLPCGSTTITVDIIGCVAMTICMETNGSLTVTGGTGPFSWSQPIHTVTCVSGFGSCGFFQKAGMVHSWGNIGSGTNIMPPAGADTVMVTDSYGSTYTSFDISTLPACSIPLNIQLVSFDGIRKAHKKDIILKWHTSSETNNDYFTIKKSYDSINWTFVKMVDGSGTVTHTVPYMTEDDNNDQLVIYYKLLSADFDGTEYDLRSIALPINPDDEIISDIYPNPINNEFHFIYGGNNNDAPLYVMIIDATGRIVKEKTINALANAQVFGMDVSELASGVYQLNCVQGDHTVYHKIVIQR